MATAPSGKPFVSYLRVPDIKNEDPFTNPQMQFATRNGKLKFREIRSLDIKNIIRTNNISSLEGFAENLIFADIDSENFEDKNFTRLIKTFQYSLEYLNSKQNMLETTNQSLENDYNQLRNESFALELRLKENKSLIQRYTREKKEKEMLLVTYKSIIDFNTTEENSEIIEKIMDHNSNAKFYCHICSGKPFSSEDKLESHMKRRHLHQRGYEFGADVSIEESFVEYGKKIEDMKAYFENLLKQQEDDQYKQLYMSNLDKMRIQNDKKLKEFENYIKSTLLDFKDLIIKSSLQNQQQPQPIIIKESAPPQQQQPVRDDSAINAELIKVTKSIVDLNNLIRSQFDNKMDQMRKELNDLKLNSSKEKIIYQTLPPQQIQPQIIIQEKERIKEVVQSQKTEQKEEIQKISSIKEEKVEHKEIKEKKSEKKEEIKEPVIKYEEERTNKESYMQPSKIIQDHTIIIPSIQENKQPQRSGKIEDINSQLLPKPPELDFSKTQTIKHKKKYEKIIIKPNFSKTMTPSDRLDQFYADFNNRDNPIFEEENPTPNHYLQKIIPDDVKQDEDKLKKTLHKSILTTTKNLPSFETYENKTKKELINIIDQTLKNIDEVNSKNEVSQLYFDTVQKAIDWKLYEAEKEEIKKKMEGGSKIKRTKSKASRASEVIKESQNIEI